MVREWSRIDYEGEGSLSDPSPSTDWAGRRRSLVRPRKRPDEGAFARDSTHEPATCSHAWRVPSTSVGTSLGRDAMRRPVARSWMISARGRTRPARMNSGVRAEQLAGHCVDRDHVRGWRTGGQGKVALGTLDVEELVSPGLRHGRLGAPLTGSNRMAPFPSEDSMSASTSSHWASVRRQNATCRNHYRHHGHIRETHPGGATRC